MELLYRFHTFSLVDYPPDRLRKSSNVFALVLEAAWYNLQSNKLSDEEKLVQKSNLVRRLLKTKYQKEQLKRMINFVKYYVAFKEPKYLIKFEKEILNNRESMGITESIIAEVREQCIQYGVEQGVKQGDLQRAVITIRNLHARGFNIQEICAIVDMEYAKVDDIIRQILNEKEV